MKSSLRHLVLILLFAGVIARTMPPVRAAGATPSAAETPRRGGTLRLASPSDWRTLDPAIAYDAEALPLMKLLFRGLIDYGAANDLVPDQASDWNVSPDGKTYVFHLRPGVKFSHGREVEAADYIFSIERILDPKTGSPGQSLFLDIAGAADFAGGRSPRVTGLGAPDAQTLVIELAKPAFTFRYVLAMPFAAALPREVVRRYGADFQYHLTGSGPYRVAEWRRAVRWKFERNPHYSGTNGWVDAVEIMIGGDAAVSTMMVERGEIDRAYADAPNRLRFERDPLRRSWVHPVDVSNIGYLFLNTEMKPFDDVRVRQAVNHALDKKRLIKLTAGACVLADGIVPESMPWSNPDLPRYDFNPGRARALLREAGLPNGFKTELWFIQERTLDQRMAEGIQQDLKNVGVTVELKGLSSTAFDVKVGTRRQTPCGIYGWFQDYPDPSTFLDTLFSGDRITEQNCNNAAFYNNPEVTRRVAEAGRIIDPERRTQLFHEAEALVMRDAPWVPLTHERTTVICHPRLRGDVPHPVLGWRFENMWLAY